MEANKLGRNIDEQEKRLVSFYLYLYLCCVTSKKRLRRRLWVGRNLSSVCTEGFKIKIIHFLFSVYQDKHIVDSVNEVSEIRVTLGLIPRRI